MWLFTRLTKFLLKWWRTYEGKKGLAILGLCVLYLGYNRINPFDSTKRFYVAWLDVTKDFELQISIDTADCGLILWTRKNPSEPQRIANHTLAALRQTNFNSSNPVKIFLHGFSDAPSTSWTRLLKERYLKQEDYNIISVNWSLLAIPPWYTTAVKNARPVGQFTADFIHFLTSSPLNMSFDSFHVIGASLGGQVAGHVGHFTNGRLARITGLDPSGPLFHAEPPSNRLDPTDARFVDVIHSAGKWVGNEDLMGHVDFFPNLGVAPQPGCRQKESLDLSCSHFVSWRLFAESLSIHGALQTLVGLKCSSAEHFSSGRCCREPVLEIAEMGDRVPKTTRGKFYLYTNAHSPMAKSTKQESTDCEWVI